MSQECPECDQFKGRRKAICTGQAELSIETVNAYRTRWGLQPLPQPIVRPAKAQRERKPREARQRSGKGGSCTSCSGTLIERAKRLAAAAVDFWQDGMTLATDQQQAARWASCRACPIRDGNTCSDCGCILALKIKARSSSCPQGRWFAHHDTYSPLINPTRCLIFHVYPKIGAEWNWHWHLDNICRVAPYFQRIVIAIATGPGLASPEAVEDRLRGVNVNQWIIRPNDKTAETGTLPLLLEAVKTDDPNTVTFRAHCKGVTHTRYGVEQQWARLMWQACFDLPSVDDALASHIMAGPMKCHEPLVSKQRYRWFYAGTFFWFRNKQIFERDWATMEPTRWFVEAWPGVICRDEEAASLCHDFTDGSVLRQNYWDTVVVPSWERWKAAHPDRIKEWD